MNYIDPGQARAQIRMSCTGELYDMLSIDIARQLKRRKVSEDDVLQDFAASRKRRCAPRRGR